MPSPPDAKGAPPDPERADELVACLRDGRDALNRIVVGQEDVVDQLLIGLIAGGHALIEGAPGLGKSLLVSTLAHVCGLEFSRIQFTPDLMPADITGSNVLYHDESGRASTRFEGGPIFAQLVLTDEINRSTPKTQSALLEAMQEGTVTAGGSEHSLPKPFFVLATQNPIEMEGTYDLPEAQIDRFLLKVVVPYPSEQSVERILRQTTGVVAPDAPALMTANEVLELQRFVREVYTPNDVFTGIARLARASQPDAESAPETVRRHVRFGISPRGAQSLLLAAKARALTEQRYNVAFEDVEYVVGPTLRHRLQVNYAGVADGVTPEAVLDVLVRHAIGSAQAA